ncbi:hypothetical protein V757_02165 [Pelistega indica]|uniref:Uncharacterized protein n=1 Tax=Pelistega indica TaxID=1414851 RepID=V8G8L9_9BURK|nr:hypothetical protein [Pelistega indica]ETD72765.1 hypothetical protein V757_02165 [Pelistega indica]
MARNVFHNPNIPDEPPQREFNTAPKPLPVCEYLVEKATGIVHYYSEELAKRSDLLEPYYGPDPFAPAKAPSVPKGVASASRSKKSAVPPPPAPPVPPEVDEAFTEA